MNLIMNLKMNTINLFLDIALLLKISCQTHQSAMRCYRIHYQQIPQNKFIKQITSTIFGMLLQKQKLNKESKLN